MKPFEPVTRMIGALQKEVPNPALKNMFEGVDTSKIPETIMIWSKPAAAEVVNFYVNEYAKRAHKRGELSDKDAYTRVPIFRGVDNKTLRVVRNNEKYYYKTHTKEWLAKAAEIRAAREAA